MEKAIFAGGCFWCTEAVFLKMKGVKEVIPGYTGGAIKNPCYREVCMGITGHAEGVAITYDPKQISYEMLLTAFFGTHDPTTLNRQGNDVGTQYRSAIFYVNDDQKEKAEAFIEMLTKEEIFKNPIVTEVVAEQPFYKAEEPHHNYYNLNSEQPYCQIIIEPKLEKLKRLFSNAHMY